VGVLGTKPQGGGVVKFFPYSFWGEGWGIGLPVCTGRNPASCY